MFLSIGVIAYNEESSIGNTIESLLNQSIFHWLRQQRLKSEIVCIANGCSDKTALVAASTLESETFRLSIGDVLEYRVIDVKAKGKTNALNIYYHEASNQGVIFNILTDADIVLNTEDTLLNLVQTLISNQEAVVSTDTPIKDINNKKRKSIIDIMSLATSNVTRSMTAQISGQLYCIRRKVAKNIYFPRGLLMDDGYLKVMVCTDFFTEPLNHSRVALAKNASHTFEAYTSIKDIFNNQKRQVIGQTMVHVLCDKYLPTLSLHDRINMGETLREKDNNMPFWFSELISEHVLSAGSFLGLYPGIITDRFKRLRNMSPTKKLLYLPAVYAGTIITCIAAIRAYVELKHGMSSYWPDTKNKRI